LKIDYHQIDIPVLSWAAILERKSEVVKILHGAWLETSEGSFVEGVWDGDFTKGEFENATALMGFGGKIKKDKALFCCPCHPLERLNLYRAADRIVLSPSLAFLLKLTGLTLDHRYAHYYWDFITFVRKMENHLGMLPTQGVETINVIHCRDIEIDRDLDVRIKMKNNPPEFKDYESYRMYLTECLRKMRDNSISPARRRTYDMISTISMGYDSPACAAIAAEIGCKSTVTHKVSIEDREQYHLTGDDAGHVIAEALGMRAEIRDPKEYLMYDGMPEAEFTATGYDDEALVMSSFEGDFRQKMVVTGMHGENVWNRVSKTPVEKNIYKLDGCGCSLSEFRYRVGFIHVPLPFCGSIRLPSINRISNSAEMAPWSLWNGYDRPIPRRIVEEKGVERKLFGQEKLFLLPVYLGSDKVQLKKKMTGKSYESFVKYYNEHRKSYRLGVLLNLFGFIAFKAYMRILYAVTGKKNMIKKVGCPIPEKYRISPLIRPFLFHWGISIVQKRYII
jgi:hypothetical protein